MRNVASADAAIAVDVLFETAVAPDMEEERLRTLIGSVCAQAARVEKLAPAEVSVTVVDDVRMRELNRVYRARDATTDVLSFALLEGDEAMPEDEPVQALGDIVISWPRACEQAAAYGHSAEREVAFLVVHGFYHLLGFDHQTPADERAMLERQEAVLRALGHAR